MRKKLKWIIPLTILFFICYLVLGATIPFAKQLPVSGTTKLNFDKSKYYASSIGPDRARIIDDNEEALQIRIQMIAHAKKRVILSTFDMRSDEAGKDMLAALLNAANRGVEVEIFADGYNSWIQMEGNEYFYALSSHPKIKIILYNKVNLFTPWTAMARMHDKYVIVDDTSYILGGRNTFGFFLGSYEGHKNIDRDVFVYNTGSKESSLYELLTYYEDITDLKCCSLFHDKESIGNKKKVKAAKTELVKRMVSLKSKYPNLFETEYDYMGQTYATNTINLLKNPIHTKTKEPVVFYQLSRLFENAKHEVIIHTPYVTCDDYMLSELTKYGNKTKMMLNSSANSGNYFASIDYLNNKQDIIDTGMLIYEYEGGISYHAKTMTIDDDLSIIGSFNMDMRSAYIDTELMLVIDSKEVNKQLKNYMLSYEEDAAIVDTIDTYSYIPEGMEMKNISGKKKTIKTLFGGWLFPLLRFLM